ncbi:MAG: allantoicase [Candidatus Handelsmanbacteria bacterium RIFCSPLOWO2_12_FULL_64_10]|uniref:Probable allantoicase n=1 Tax=Handelsmanbacteria sp. (strain RIFCSPLOWO2_12_FULL_64_10) TaxID=1817868 RepID=A0A1F6D283_HANXR|nr:MAG: allantoicase [Candidatus Handelsmanbacteria bacterium RIFCSPLOWO2_12_FULL_64_10]
MSDDFSEWVNLAQPRLGAAVIDANDEFFAEKENLIRPEPPVFIEGKFTDRGKWMDGWETRRRRAPGHDWCVVRLGLPGIVRGVDIDTAHFLGNHPPEASLDAGDGSTWTEILPRSALEPGSHNLFPARGRSACTHVRLNIFPDGGVARLRVYGEAFVDWSAGDPNALRDLAAIENGGRVLACNDMFFGPKDNLILPGRGTHMGDGWETKRRRTPGHDWVIVALGHEGVIRNVEVDTAHFKGNYPNRCSIEAARSETDWKTLLPEQKLRADHRHFFESELLDVGPVTRVRLNIFPDGGVSRLRVYGRIS